MKIITVITGCLLLSAAASAQQPASDSTVSFRVEGACGMCEERIEAAASIKGVKEASWDVESKLLTVTYIPGKVKLAKIRQKIVAAGHDIGDQKANLSIYNALPDCCHYRDLDKASCEEEHGTDSTAADHLDHAAASAPAEPAAHFIKGMVMQTNRKGQFIPLAGASVVWLGTGSGTQTDEHGLFRLTPSATEHQLVVSYAGLTSDTLTITDRHELKIVLAEGQALNEVLVTSRQRSTFLATLSPVRTQIMTERELFKAACCNLSESFETNPSVDVSYNDAVTGSKQIQLLGLSGIYTQLTVENLPGPRGLATSLGLNSIAGPWIESIQLSKGTGSVVNGYESIAGQINVELKKPEKSESLYANAYINDFGKTDLNLNLARQVGKKWTTALLLHDDFISNASVDFNKDGFRDLPTGNLFSLINRWKYEDARGLMMQFGVKVLAERRTGGETDFRAGRDKFGTDRYGLGIHTNRYEAFAKIGYVFPQQKYKSIGLQLAGFQHEQDSYFGLTTYDGRQRNLYANLIYQSVISNTRHKFRTGLSYLNDRYREQYQGTPYHRTESVPGAFFEYTYDNLKGVMMVAGIRSDYHNLFGWFITPRLNIRLQPFPGNTIHLSLGRGQRTANIFAENSSVLVSAREVLIRGSRPGGAYGLSPEVGWNKGISIDQKLHWWHRNALLSIDFFRNDFSNQVVTDLENPRQVQFYNLQGKSFSNSLQAELQFEPIKKLEMRLAYRYFDVRTTYNGVLLKRPLVAAHRVFSNLAWSAGNWKLDFTVSWNSSKRLPSTVTNPAAYRMGDRSPAYAVMAGQVSRSFGPGKNFDLYIGVENLGNYYQRNVILSAAQPFGPYFDATMVWGPVSGRMFYLGWRLKMK